jgi:hypothetical protein
LKAIDFTTNLYVKRKTFFFNAGINFEQRKHDHRLFSCEGEWGAAGIDGMKASELQSYLNNAWSGLKAAIMEGSYVLQTRYVSLTELYKRYKGRS